MNTFNNGVSMVPWGQGLVFKLLVIIHGVCNYVELGTLANQLNKVITGNIMLKLP